MLMRGKAKPSCAAEGVSPEPASKGYEENIEDGGEPQNAQWSQEEKLHYLLVSFTRLLSMPLIWNQIY